MTTPASSGSCFADESHHLQAPIVAHRQIAERTWRIRLDCPEIAAAARPGQFAMLRIPGRSDPLLARPLAVYDTVADDSGTPRYADFIYLVHGKFTSTLRTLRPDDVVAVWGPLGNGFDPPAVDHLLLVAGGIGNTALLALARERLGSRRYGLPPRTAPGATRVTFCWGARHAGMFGDIDDFRNAGCDVHMATLDGSAGLRGTVVDLLESLATPGGPLATASLSLASTASMHVACCGPEPMMAAVADWSARHKLGCHVSLEEPMACGIGICFTCVAKIRDDHPGHEHAGHDHADGETWDYRRTCIEGPVFDARQVVW
jgi:dihydroorotate dehydrogenase electron transfer subunit